MKRCGGLFALSLLLGLGALAQALRESGWVSLFNGKDLSGWKKNGDEKWIVEQGTILCESRAKQVWIPDYRKDVSGFHAAPQIQKRGRRQQRRVSSLEDSGY